jgi:flagellar hook assembly protein FlgD
MTLQIYSITGKILNSWTVKGAGYHNIRWNGRDANGNQLPTGLYFARLYGGSKLLQKKLLMVK